MLLKRPRHLVLVLIVQEVRDALGLLLALGRGGAHYDGLTGAARWPQLSHGSRLELDACLSQSRVDCLAGTLEFCTTQR